MCLEKQRKAVWGGEEIKEDYKQGAAELSQLFDCRVGNMGKSFLGS